MSGIIEKPKEHYSFDIKIKKRMEAEFNLFMYDFYHYIDERVIDEKEHLEITNKYLFNRLLKDVLNAVLNNHFNITGVYKDNNIFSFEFTSDPKRSTSYVTIEDESLELFVGDAFTVAWIFLGYAQHDKYFITNDWKSYVKEERGKYTGANDIQSKITIKLKDESKALLDEYKKAVPGEKAIITQKDIYDKLDIPRTTFESRCRSNGFVWDKKRRSFVDLKGNPM
jgi:hypothetical protein